jgi:hypothetical protein
MYFKNKKPGKKLSYWFGKYTICIGKEMSTGKESYLLYNDEYAVSISVFKGEDLITAYRFNPKNIQDTMYIISTDSVVFSFTEGDHWFEGIDGHFLLIDIGCCPGPRGLQIINLLSCDTILNVSYTKIINYNSLQTLTYYSPLRPATKADCPNYDRDIKNGFEPYLEEAHSFNLNTRESKALGKYRCAAYQ